MIIYFGLREVTEHYNLGLVDFQLKKNQLTAQIFSNIRKDKQKQEQEKILWTFAKSNPKCFDWGARDPIDLYKYMQQKKPLRYSSYDDPF